MRALQRYDIGDPLSRGIGGFSIFYRKGARLGAPASARTREHANMGEHPLFACSLLYPTEKTEPRRLPRDIATFWWQPTHAARAETACGLCRARRRKTSVAKLKVPKPSACRFRGNNLRPALSGRSKNKTLRRKNTRRLGCGGSANSTLSALACGRLCQPPAPGTRAVGCSRSAPSENAAVENRFQGRS